jgi:hypothetical protein
VREVRGVLPVHMRSDGDEKLWALLEPFGTEVISRASTASERQ